MQIQSLSIRNFKSIRELEILDVESSLILVGKNGFWKDNKKEDDRIEMLWKVNMVYLQYLDENNKKKKVVIKKESYKDYFANH